MNLGNIYSETICLPASCCRAVCVNMKEITQKECQLNFLLFESKPPEVNAEVLEGKQCSPQKQGNVSGPTVSTQMCLKCSQTCSKCHLLDRYPEHPPLLLLLLLVSSTCQEYLSCPSFIYFHHIVAPLFSFCASSQGQFVESAVVTFDTPPPHTHTHTHLQLVSFL